MLFDVPSFSEDSSVPVTSDLGDVDTTKALVIVTVLLNVNVAFDAVLVSDPAVEAGKTSATRVASSYSVVSLERPTPTIFAPVSVAATV